MEKGVFIVDGARTAFGKLGGTLKDLYGAKLASIALRGLVEKTKITEKTKVDSVMMGSAYHCAQASNPARWALLDAGLGYETSASYVEMQCGSAIDSINHAAAKILTGQAEVVIAGGFESISTRFAKFSMSTPPYKFIPPTAIPGQLSPVAEERIPMGMTAENLAIQYNISRQAQDAFAYNSQMRCKKAMENGWLDDEIVPVQFPATRKTPAYAFVKDEHPRPDTTLEGLAKLTPAFKSDGTVTAGNASGLNDGASFVLMMTEEKVRELGYEPYARWITGADMGCDPRVMGIAPAYAIPVAMKRAGLKIRDLGVMECNEAFAVQNLAVVKEVQKQMNEDIDMEKWNPLGGAIAYGHPNGGSGGRICIFTMKELARRKERYGLFSSCCGGGLGVVTVIENVRL